MGASPLAASFAVHVPPLSYIAPALVIGVALRIRRSIGRQRVRPVRMSIRIALLSGALGFVALSHFDPTIATATLVGALAGSALAALGVRHTRFERVDGQRWYRPNTYIGLAVIGLFTARLVYRLAMLSPQLASAAPGDSQLTLLARSRSPLTMATLGAVMGYYLAYFSGVLRVARRLSAQGV
jgi:hypothetical protein